MYYICVCTLLQVISSTSAAHDKENLWKTVDVWMDTIDVINNTGICGIRNKKKQWSIKLLNCGQRSDYSNIKTWLKININNPWQLYYLLCWTDTFFWTMISNEQNKRKSCFKHSWYFMVEHRIIIVVHGFQIHGSFRFMVFHGSFRFMVFHGRFRFMIFHGHFMWAI